MTLLPPQITLPTDQIKRRHRPARGPYETYRACLQWEFGFLCAFCFVHETDLNEHGHKGFGVMWIEHKTARSEDSRHQDVYRNCFYCCRFCNQARSNRSRVSRDGHHLLDPCESVWSEMFEPHEDRLRPRNEDARYTHQVYDLDDPRKTSCRAHRRTTLNESLRTLRETQELILRLLDDIAAAPAARGRSLLEAAQQLRGLARLTAQTMRRFVAVPAHALPRCRCSSSTPGKALSARSLPCTLPSFLQEQLLSDLPEAYS